MHYFNIVSNDISLLLNPNPKAMNFLHEQNYKRTFLLSFKIVNH